MGELITWRPGAIELDISSSADRPPMVQRFTRVGDESVPEPASALPIAEIHLGGEGSGFSSSERLMGSAVGRRLRFVDHRDWHQDGMAHLEVTAQDPVTQIVVISRWSSWPDLPVVRCETEVCAGTDAVELRAVSSVALGGISSPGAHWWLDHEVGFAHNTWFREMVWQRRTPAELGLDDAGLDSWGITSSRASFAIGQRGSWSTGGHLPMGVLRAGDQPRSLLWQVEHNGAWRWELGDQAGALYLVTSGPTDQSSAWMRRLSPGERFCSVPTTLVLAGDDDELFGALTRARRRVRRPHPDNDALPVIVNDYMNALMGDPTSENIPPFIDAAERAGAEIYCMDSGWYTDGATWWNDLGSWEPSLRRFPEGLRAMTNRMRDAGMIAGLWLEPEVVSVSSPVAHTLPPEAFFQRDGKPVIESGRLQLDFRHPAALAHVDGAVERLVVGLDLGYLKFDYNMDVTQGTDVDADSPGDGQLGHQRALLDWVRDLMDRHPGLVIENCASGGQRMDAATLAVHPVQSTSDNQDPLFTASIAAAAPTAVTPEQGAVWAYPDPSWSAERIAFSLASTLLGRVHLGGRLDLLSSPQMELVRAGLAAYRETRDRLPAAVPFWPLGLPGWHDPVVALGMRDDAGELLTVWRRSGPTTVSIPLARHVGRELDVEVVFPKNLPTQVMWHAPAGELVVELPDEPAARTLRLRHP
ncbi:MAG: alpha-galactosidase [Microbacterium sp.]|uniref:glycoside hydrolase family 36 protein n=1 Tax=Microbacterium sp. TaxID=51671 RepID=UPI001E029DF1|nr:glycoside hydrolase family 36 protein [Microbacterium sp.]MBW8762015.1 alpha-galactosidase [Microbacterium sp.]